jgi:hypothetical protein
MGIDYNPSKSGEILLAEKQAVGTGFARVFNIESGGRIWNYCFANDLIL